MLQRYSTFYIILYKSSLYNKTDANLGWNKENITNSSQTMVHAIWLDKKSITSKQFLNSMKYVSIEETSTLLGLDRHWNLLGIYKKKVNKFDWIRVEFRFFDYLSLHLL